MEKKDIINLIYRSKEYNRVLISDYISIYLNMLIFVKESSIERHNLTNFLNEYFEYNKLETRIIKYIKLKYNNYNKYICEGIVNDLDDIFFKYFQYIEWVLKGYEDAIEMNDKYRAVIPKKEFKLLDKNDLNSYRKKLEKIV